MSIRVDKNDSQCGDLGHEFHELRQDGFRRSNRDKKSRFSVSVIQLLKDTIHPFINRTSYLSQLKLGVIKSQLYQSSMSKVRIFIRVHVLVFVYDFSRPPCCYCPSRNIFCNQRTSTNNCSFTNSYTRHNHRIHSNQTTFL